MLLTRHPEGLVGYYRRYAELFSAAPEMSVRVEKTSNYFENEEARTLFPKVLHEAQLLFILREPVARAYSNWLWSTRNGLETLSFAEAVAADGKRTSPIDRDRPHARPFDYLVRGNYGTLAQLWGDAIGRHRLHFLMFEEAIDEPDTFAARLQHIAGLDPLRWELLQTGVVNAHGLVAPELDPGLADELRRHFAPEMKRLAALTGLDVARWGY